MRNAANLVAEISYENALQELLNLETLSMQEPAHIVDIAAFFRHSHREVRYAAAAAIGRLGDRASAYLPQLVSFLTERDRFVHFAAIEALGQLGTTARTATSHIAELLRHASWDVRFDALEVLAELDAEEYIPQIIKLLDDPDFRVRFAAVEALGKGAATYVPKSQLAARLPGTIQNVLSMTFVHRSYEQLIHCLINFFLFVSAFIYKKPL